MGLRQKSALKPALPEEGNDGASSLPKKRRAKTKASRSSIHLVTQDAKLAKLLNTPGGANRSIPNGDEAGTAGKVEEAKQTLGKLECEVISALFPTSGAPQSFEDIASRLGMSVKEVQEIADNALRGLRGPRGPAVRISTVWN